MADQKSQIITDLDAVPVVKTNQLEIGGRIRAAFATAELAAMAAGEKCRMVRIPSRARVVRVLFASDDLGTGGTVDIGLYRTTADGGAVVDADVFASAVDTDTAAVNRTDVTYESAVVAPENAGKALWEQLNLSSDPKVDYDVAITRNAANGTGTVSLWVEYVLDE